MLLRYWILSAVAVVSPAQTFTTLASFNSTGGNAANPESLIQGADGNFYGTASNPDHGAVFKVTPSGTLTTLYTFPVSGNGGELPYGRLVQGSDGNLYGTTEAGGASDDGTVFKITPGGTLTILYSFTGKTDGGRPSAGLVQATDGNFYGLTSEGGQGYGTFFSISPGGTLTTLANLGSTFYTGGASQSGLIQATDGNFYGTTAGGGTLGLGTVVKITPAGMLTTLYSFTGHSDGSQPNGGLIQATDGNLYGTATGISSDSFGTVFKVTLGGTLTTLYSFTSGNGGDYPTSGVIQASDGNFYGSNADGAHGHGTIFRLTPAGTLTTLYSFTGAVDGGTPAGLVQGTDGNFYGMTQFSEGTVFKLQLGLPPLSLPPTITPNGVVPVYSSVPTIQAGEWVSIYGSNLAGKTATWNNDFPVTLAGTSVTINGKSAYLWFVSSTQINLQTPTDAATGTVPVVVTTGSGTVMTTVTLAQVAPSFNLLDSKHVAGIILRTDGSGGYGGGTYDILGPTGTSLGFGTVAAKAGDTVELFGVGFGPTNPLIPAGAPYSGSAPTTNQVTLLINNGTVAPFYAGETSAGLYQINITVPPGLGTGDVPVQATVGGSQTPTGVVIPLQ